MTWTRLPDSRHWITILAESQEMTNFRISLHTATASASKGATARTGSAKLYNSTETIESLFIESFDS